MDDEEDLYAHPSSLLGALQRGMGRGAIQAMDDPAAAVEAVLSCLRRDHRWAWDVDERAVYLARLVCDLEIPIDCLLAVLDQTPPEDDENGAALTLEVLETLGRAGHRQAIDGVRRHIIQGPHWLQALHVVGPSWDAELWEDLYPHLRDRIATVDRRLILCRSLPWTRWAAQDERVAAAIVDARNASARPLSEPAADPELAQARRWAATPDHPQYWLSVWVLARTGDEHDVPALLEAAGRVRTRDGGLGWCYRDLVAGLTRIGGDRAAQIVPRLKRLWFSPHTYERAAVLKALMVFAPAGEPPWQLLEGLWDCEADVRELAAAHVPFIDTTRARLRYLRDDPMETFEVRAAAAQRLG
ncbi:hypothetical protein GCM10010402_82170 [Actinomadura luteofluorescens]|uniref:hypothetical protein n=1 Tax=Actinomadura luteofluorescens TaxID=46163 RepID=UPI002164B1ED|nr:hypothetical protein [Actinomadura glauciflava]MCR3738988.1 hypothetical protein [Actinomadura glauciflava]